MFLQLDIKTNSCLKSSNFEILKYKTKCPGLPYIFYTIKKNFLAEACD